MSKSKNDSPGESPAEVYDRFFVPALFQQWGNIIAEIAGVKPGQRVLDVACGTGVLTLAAEERVGSDGDVAGLDANPEMLSVARSKSGRIQWREGRAEALPFPDQSFDAALSQFALMFFDDPPAALGEMMRVLKPGGQLAVAVCAAVDHSPGYAVFAELLHRLFGHHVAEAFRAPFSLGDPEQLLSLADQAGILDAKISRHEGSVQFASVASMISTERACLWTLGGQLDDTSFDRLLYKAEESLHPFVKDNGRIHFTMPALVLTATRR